MTTNNPNRDPAVEAINRLDQRLAGEHKDNVGRLDKMDARMARLEAGFVGGDPEGHRRYHELVIEQMEDKKKIRRELMAHLIKSSSWVALSGVVWFLFSRSKDWLVVLLKGM